MIIPPFLSKGDKVGVIATSKKVIREHLYHGLDILASWGLEIEIAPNVLKGTKFLAGLDSERKADLQDFINKPDIKAIFCARGGYGAGRILDSIDWHSLLANPKWILGFSDITLLHLKLNQLGMASIHCAMPAIFHKTDPAALNSIREFLMEGNMTKLTAKPQTANRPGKLSGLAVGGNLSMICSTLGTPNEIDTRDKILILEEVDEPLYKIDRMFDQLKKAGKLESIKAIITGHFTLPDNESNEYDFTIHEIISHYIDSYNYPSGTGISFGHERMNFAIPLGIPLLVEIGAEGSEINLDL